MENHSEVFKPLIEGCGLEEADETLNVRGLERKAVIVEYW